MISLLKTFGKGLLYVIGAPFFIVALLLFGAIGLIAFIFQIIKSVIFFFTGQKFFPELPEDRKLRLMREAANPSEEEEEDDEEDQMISPIFEEELPAPEPAPIFIERNEPAPQKTIEETVFEDTSSLEDFIDDEEELSKPQDEEEEIEEKHTLLQTSKEEEESEEEEEYEELETYVPRSSTYSASNDDDDDNSTDTGVDIKYDL